LLLSEADGQNFVDQATGSFQRDGTKQLERSIGFDNFARALEFMRRVGEKAEEKRHHPAHLT
jgi:pterin-4a-carbinolamine dehydratase